MNSTEVPPTRVRTAIALSIAAHVCVFFLLAALLRDRPPIPWSDDGPELTVTTIERHAPPPIRWAAAPPTVTGVQRRLPGTARTAPPSARTAEAYTAVERLVAPVRASPPKGPRVRPRVLRPASAPAVALVTPPSTAISARLATGAPATLVRATTMTPSALPRAPTMAPSALPRAPTGAPPTPAATPTRSAALGANFGGLFSQNYPPALAAPAALATIRSQLSGPVRIRIDVDETGHATEVRFVGPVSNPEVEQAVRSTLLALRYVPADCNGLHCDGTLEIAY